VTSPSLMTLRGTSPATSLEMRLKMPSEHMVNGHQFAAELQVMHQNQKTVLDFDEEDQLITSFFFEVGEESKLLHQLMHSTGSPKKAGDFHVVNTPVDLQWALGPVIDGPYFSYNGSCTQTCAEVAQWVLFENTMTLSMEQLVYFKTIFPNPGNNRPIQALNGRPVTKNTLMEPAAVDYIFFLNREMGRNRSAVTPPQYILFPILGTLTLCITVMAGTFVREEKRQMTRSAGGFASSTDERATMMGRRS